MAESLTNSYEAPDSIPRNMKRKEGGKERKGETGQEEREGRRKSGNEGRKRISAMEGNQLESRGSFFEPPPPHDP